MTLGKLIVQFQMFGHISFNFEQSKYLFGYKFNFFFSSSDPELVNDKVAQYLKKTVI